MSGKEGFFLGRRQNQVAEGSAHRDAIQWCRGWNSDLGVTGLPFPFSPVEDVVLHSESSSLSESGASHDNGENYPPACLTPPVSSQNICWFSPSYCSSSLAMPHAPMCP